MLNPIMTMLENALTWALDHWFIILTVVLTCTALLPCFEKPARRREPVHQPARSVSYNAASHHNHRHYCDTCRHSRWSNGECRCCKYGYIGKGGSVSCKAGCPDWVSRS